MSDSHCCAAALCGYATWSWASKILTMNERACISLCIAMLASLVFMVSQPVLVHLYTGMLYQVHMSTHAARKRFGMLSGGELC